ncbi:MAG: succinate--CoA ligase subunit alpha [Desulfovibrionaceae bacterium]
MLLNEHQSKRLFAKAGVAVPQGVLLTPGTYKDYAPGGDGPWYVKAQVLCGGRGKAGGILRVADPKDMAATCERVLGKTIKGERVPLIRVEYGASIGAEYYLSFAVARNRESLVLSVSRAGGMEVEANRDAILVQDISFAVGLTNYQIRAAFFHLGVKQAHFATFTAFLRSLYQAVCDNKLLLAEINPLTLTPEGVWLALDGKVEIDDNQRDLNPELDEYYTPQHVSAEERRAREAGLSYVGLHGWVGIMVNGAGLAMATMDLLNFNGLSAANFMDLGGAANAQRMSRAMDILNDNPAVGAAFINLFGGIVSCRDVAGAIRDSLAGEAPKKPLVVRMDGLHAAEGRAVLAALGQPDIHIASTTDEALDILRRIKPEDAPVIPFERPAMPMVDILAPPTGGLDSSAPLGIAKGGKVLVQGITGKAAQTHVALMLEYGTHIAAGVTPFKGGQVVQGVPVYDSVHAACRDHAFTASIIFVPAAFAADAILEAAQCDIPNVVCITEGITQEDMLRVRETLRASRSTSRVIGPNTPGVIVPGAAKIGIMPGHVFTPGPVAVLSRSGTLTYETAARLTAAGIGQSVCVGIGGDPFIGSSFTDLAMALRDHMGTRALVVLGEIGGRAEEDLARYVRETRFAKPVVHFIAGRTAPKGKRLGHAGAILEEGGGGIEAKLAVLEQAGFVACPDLQSIPQLVGKVLG